MRIIWSFCLGFIVPSLWLGWGIIHHTIASVLGVLTIIAHGVVIGFEKKTIRQAEQAVKELEKVLKDEFDEAVEDEFGVENDTTKTVNEEAVINIVESGVIEPARRITHNCESTIEDKRPLIQRMIKVANFVKANDISATENIIGKETTSDSEDKALNEFTENDFNINPNVL